MDKMTMGFKILREDIKSIPKRQRNPNLERVKRTPSLKTID
jgi:hypothetical protein